MSTKRPSVSTNSNIIQKYVGSDYDKIVALAQQVPAIVEILTKADELDAAIAAANAIVLEGTDGFVEEPLLDYTVNYLPEGFTEDTLGAYLGALALQVKSNQQAIIDFLVALSDSATAVGTIYDPLGGGYDAGLTDVKKVLDALKGIFIQSGALVLADLATQSAPFAYLTVNGVENLPNDGLGADTDVTYAPESVTGFYDVGANQLELSDFKLGDLVTLRINLNVTPSVIDQEVNFILSLSEGTPSAQTIQVSRETFSAVSAYEVAAEVTFTINSNDMISNPGHIQVQSSADASVTVNTFQVFTNTKN